ncbi:MerR family transcriptional regulator [Evansella cellulosilytica]|uniref:Transcriptional regulator, MerR family n=1 Tax=Evansella cellulosilytica (strain ATCC 21833 / DSM 2522 / FERM P-1141 / JCM 9156 / N-4) TaxID=649639 RepID=E6TVN9_EVAC2|nr:MerR family transcriptional regulator [Evansella cellulosilytica]ADU32167.1 transcriptional regulator, MerR family [Evansella cellulosilytica DSM 2522]
MEKLYSIQEVSKILGISKDTLRYYDRIGIVTPSREENRYRTYSKNDLIDLMNIQIMQYADFSLEEIRGKLNFHKMDNIDPAYCKEVAEFLDAKNAEIRRKVAHLEKVSRLLDVAAETLRDFNNERDQNLKKIVREIYKNIQKEEVEIPKEGCGEHQS